MALFALIFNINFNFLLTKTNKFYPEFNNLCLDQEQNPSSPDKNLFFLRRKKSDDHSILLKISLLSTKQRWL